VDDKLHVVTMISNPVRYKSRYRLYKQFKDYMSAEQNVVLHTVEVAYGDRPFEVTDRDDPNNYQFRTSCEIWHKENALNLGIARLPCNWKYMAWVDADIEFLRPNVSTSCNTTTWYRCGRIRWTWGRTMRRSVLREALRHIISPEHCRATLASMATRTQAMLGRRVVTLLTQSAVFWTTLYSEVLIFTWLGPSLAV